MVATSDERACPFSHGDSWSRGNKAQRQRGLPFPIAYLGRRQGYVHLCMGTLLGDCVSTAWTCFLIVRRGEATVGGALVLRIHDGAPLAPRGTLSSTWASDYRESDQGREIAV